MSIRALDGISPEWYTIPDQEECGEEDKAQFRIWPLTGPQLLEVNQHFELETSTIAGPGLYLAFKLGCKDWRNIKDRRDEEMKFSKLNFDYIPPQVLAQVGSRIVKISMLTEEELGNLSSQ